MKKFFETCVFTHTRQMSETEYHTMPMIFHKVIIIKTLFEFIRENFFRYGKQNGFKTYSSDQRKEYLRLVVATPNDMVNMLTEFMYMSSEEKTRIINHFKTHSQPDFDPNELPDETKKGFKETEHEAWLLYQKSQHAYYSKNREPIPPIDKNGAGLSTTGQ